MKKALIVVDHGSRKAEANELLGDIVRELRKISPELIIHGAHMELAEPSIADSCKQAISDGAEEVIVSPYMLSPGRHAREDIPRMVDEIAKCHPKIRFRVTEPLGLHRKILEVVLERASLV